jgi:AraC family transcriptional regulator
MDNGNGYITRINRVIDHLNANLRSAYSLDELAEVACFSPYHFHRVFKSITGETVHEYAKRLRLEKAARLAADNKFKMAEIAVECGFESTTDLSRSFKARFGVPPSRFTRNAWLKHTRGDELAPQLKIVGLQQPRRPATPTSKSATSRRNASRTCASSARTSLRTSCAGGRSFQGGP